MRGLNPCPLQDLNELHDQACLASHPDLAANIAQMCADRIVFDVQLLTDLLMIQPFTNQPRNLNLSPCQMPGSLQIVPLLRLEIHSPHPSNIK